MAKREYNFTVSWQDAKLGRLEYKKNFVFEKEWNKKYKVFKYLYFASNR